MSNCKECGFKPGQPEFCSEVCRVFWKRRTTDPQYWTNLPREVADKTMSEETKQKLREYNDRKKAAKQAEADALAAENAAAVEEQGF